MSKIIVHFEKSEPMVVTNNPEKIYKELGWKANLNIFDIVNKMYQYKKKLVKQL